MKPVLLIAAGGVDAEFLYACRFAVERACYVRFAEGDDVLLVPALELERARRESRAALVRDLRELGWTERLDDMAAWAEAAARLLSERGVGAVRISPRLPAGYYVALRETGLDLELDRRLFLEERRRKSSGEASLIRAAQQAAEAACVEVIASLAAAEVGRDGHLGLEGRPLTSERLKARAEAALQEMGFSAPEMIVAGSPDSGLPHARGSGPLAAHAPIVIDIFPRGAASHYHGDLTRTVVVGEAGSEFGRMHEACVDAMKAAISELRAGTNGRDVHRTVCGVLVEQGYGTTTAGFEGRDGPKMNHSTGHGVGLEVHEAPLLRDLDYPLQAADVVTVEPGLYQLGLGGVRVEDTGMVTESGFDDFTSLPTSLDPRDYL